MLDLLADYVDSIANGDVSLIVLSGYVPNSASAQSNIPISKIDSFIAKRTNTEGEIVIEIPTITNHGTVNYYCVCSETVPLLNTTLIDGQLILSENNNKVRFDYSKSRRKSFLGLTPGVTYYFYVFASNTVSVSPISDVKSLMAA